MSESTILVNSFVVSLSGLRVSHFSLVNFNKQTHITPRIWECRAYSSDMNVSRLGNLTRVHATTWNNYIVGYFSGKMQPVGLTNHLKELKQKVLDHYRHPSSLHWLSFTSDSPALYSQSKPDHMPPTLTNLITTNQTKPNPDQTKPNQTIPNQT